MAKVRWFLELFYIANIDADYLDDLTINFRLVHVLSMIFRYNVPNTDFRTTTKQRKLFI